MTKRELKRQNSRIGYSRFLTTSSPFQLDADLLTAHFHRQHRKRRAAGRHGARAGREVKTVAVIGAADLCLLEDAGREGGAFVRAQAIADEVLAGGLDQEHSAAAELDGFHLAGR